MKKSYEYLYLLGGNSTVRELEKEGDMDCACFLRRKERMDAEAMWTTSPSQWEGEKAREQEGGGWAHVLGGGRARTFM